MCRADCPVERRATRAVSAALGSAREIDVRPRRLNAAPHLRQMHVCDNGKQGCDVVDDGDGDVDDDDVDDCSDDDNPKHYAARNKRARRTAGVLNSTERYHDKQSGINSVITPIFNVKSQRKRTRRQTVIDSDDESSDRGRFRREDSDILSAHAPSSSSGSLMTCTNRDHFSKEMASASEDGGSYSDETCQQPAGSRQTHFVASASSSRSTSSRQSPSTTDVEEIGSMPEPHPETSHISSLQPSRAPSAMYKGLDCNLTKSGIHAIDGKSSCTAFEDTSDRIRSSDARTAIDQTREISGGRSIVYSGLHTESRADASSTKRRKTSTGKTGKHAKIIKSHQKQHLSSTHPQDALRRSVAAEIPTLSDSDEERGYTLAESMGSAWCFGPQVWSWRQAKSATAELHCAVSNQQSAG